MLFCGSRLCGRLCVKLVVLTAMAVPVSHALTHCSWESPRARDSLDKIRQKSLAQLPSPDDATDLKESSLKAKQKYGSISTGSVNFEPPVTGTRTRCSAVCSRYPRNKALVLVLVLNFIGSYGFGAAITGILTIFNTNTKTSFLEEKNMNLYKLQCLIFQHCASYMFYPIAGFIADVYVGRYKMIRISLFFLWLAYAMITISFIYEETSTIIHPTLLVALLRVIAFLLLCVGGGGFVAVIIPFGVDQLQGASSTEISSYFHFFYFGRNLAMACGIFVYCSLTYLIHKNYSQQEAMFYSVQSLVTMAVLTAGILLNRFLNHWYFKDKQRENPVKLVARVLCFAALVKRRTPGYRRAFRYGEERKPRTELAKYEYDGKFSSENVEDVKAFCRICLILISLSPALSATTAVSGTACVPQFILSQYSLPQAN